jgi:PleD family two-component response regulator
MKQNSQKTVILAADDPSTNIDVIKDILSKEYLVQTANRKVAVGILHSPVYNLRLRLPYKTG